MNILAFDTCFSACSATVQTSDGLRVSEKLELETGHAEALMPMIERVMLGAELAFSALDCIVVTNGPGSFTGVRTSVAAARSLTMATGAELVGVSSLWAIATGELDARQGKQPFAGPSDNEFDGVLVVMDARKGQVYAQVVDRSGAELTEPLLLAVEAAAALMPNLRLVTVGTASRAVTAAASAFGRATPPLCSATAAIILSSPDSKYLLAAAARSSMSGVLRPLYLRPPDAKPQADKSLPWSS